jgi:hypothetical protein
MLLIDMLLCENVAPSKSQLVDLLLAHNSRSKSCQKMVLVILLLSFNSEILDPSHTTVHKHVMTGCYTISCDSLPFGANPQKKKC